MKSSAKQFVLGGVAGSGKSTIIPYIQRLYHHVQVCAYTGKAVTVLLRKGIIGARTLHSFLYRATTEKLPSGEIATVFTPMPDIMFGNISLVVVDEASMVNKEIYDLLSSKHFKVIYIGDHFQLPPVKDTFNIMENPDFKMEAVLRQNEHNPIIMLATKARIGEPIPYGKFGDSYHTMNLQEKDLVKFNQVITWTNAAKDHFNESIRRILGYNSNQPTAGDKMIVKVNCRVKNLYNGQIVYIHGMPAPCQSQRLWRVGLFDELAHNDAFVMASTDSAINCVASVHLTKEELDEAKRKTAELCKEINDPLMIEALTIDDENPYEHPNPFIFERIYYYSTMSDYARYNLAKKRLEEEGYKWNDKFNLNPNTDKSVELMKIYEYYNPDVAYLRNLK